MYRCDYKTGVWRGALSQISDGCQYAENNEVRIPAKSHIWRILKWLEKEKMVVYAACDRRSTTLSIVNWHSYQHPDGELETAKEQQKNSKRTSIRSTKKIEEENQLLMSDNNRADILEIQKHYGSLINPRSRLTEGAKKKIRIRLKNYQVVELKDAIGRFASQEWWMENNAHRGIAWFFASDDRVDQFLNLQPVIPTLHTGKDKPEMPEWAKPILKPPQQEDGR